MFVAIRFFSAVAFAVVIFVVLGAKFYLPLAAIVVIVSFMVMIANESHHREQPDKLTLPSDDTLERAAIDYLTLLGLAAFVGVLWPSMPLIIWYART